MGDLVGSSAYDPLTVLAWALAAAALLGAFALFAASVNGALLAHGEGRRVSAGAALPVRETARLLRQRRRTTPAADSLLWRVGASSFLILALLKVSLVPLGDAVVFPSSVGLVWFNALDAAVWAAVWLAGWGANAVHPLLGGYRFLALAIAYELPLMFTLVAPAVAAGSLDVQQIAAAQSEIWYLMLMPVAFLIYCISVLAFSVMGPFAAPFSSDIAGGVDAELSGVDRLLVAGGRYALLAAGSAFAVPLFLGGGAGPLLPGWAWVLIKALVLLGALVALRRALPLARPDRFLEMGWLVLLPLALVQDLVVGIGAVMASGGMSMNE
ncbi:NADH-quinone oxidoreductase subunit H [Microbacterium sp. LRZ72]|uniref:NADH-quinone oxidoreductase subunit H n=1 Tax=Microbacterium sp. LRZ72 TaxID=2942481 RepID=UPI0029ACE81D|nr:NADH-quinone oxidoreductase subunit H [Microbacterium sp. LRZ72]MDX2377726.1 NADH-quinone oxidoreductase subunit H [Microbacterium sp. LRZ72]